MNGEWRRVCAGWHCAGMGGLGNIERILRYSLLVSATRFHKPWQLRESEKLSSKNVPSDLPQPLGSGVTTAYHTKRASTIVYNDPAHAYMYKRRMISFVLAKNVANSGCPYRLSVDSHSAYACVERCKEKRSDFQITLCQLRPEHSPTGCQPWLQLHELQSGSSGRAGTRSTFSKSRS